MTVVDLLALTDEQVITHVAGLTAVELAEQLLRVRDNELALARILVAIANTLEAP